MLYDTGAETIQSHKRGLVEVAQRVTAGASTASPYDALLRDFESLQRSEAALRDFAGTSTISRYCAGKDGTILWANQAELDLLGYKRGKIYRQKYLRLSCGPKRHQ